METKNYGLDLTREKAELRGDEHVFGAVSSPDCLYAIPLDFRLGFLPMGELQIGRQDWMDCVTRGVINILEMKFTYALRKGLIKPENVQWLREQGYIVVRDGLQYVEFSDRFIAMKSGTTREGNSMKNPPDAVRKVGLIPKSKLPANPKMRWDDYHNTKDITPEMEKLGQEFIKRWAIAYEQVFLVDLESLIKRDCVNLAAYAWPKPVDGIYPKTEGPFNHAIMGFALPRTKIFDNYPDAYDGDWVKQLAPDYPFFEYGYRPFIKAEQIPSERAETLSLLERILKHVKEFLEGMMPPKAYDQDPKTLPMNQEEPKPITSREELYKAALAKLGVDASPKDLAPDDLACAESVSEVIASVTAFPIITGTYTLMSHLNFSKKFKSILLDELRVGDILLYPTGSVKAPFPGHVFIVGETNLMSNNSNTGKWDTHYTIPTARKRWEEQGGYKPHCYRLIDNA